MGYVAVTAGEELIERAEALFDKQRISGADPAVDIDQLDGQLGRLTGQAMSEAGLYAPRLAARAIKQAQGDTVEAAFLLRAYRSTLERYAALDPVDPDDMLATRRVSPAFKDVPGGQLLGPTKDYTQRLLDFDLDGADPTADWEFDGREEADRDGEAHDTDRDGEAHDTDRDGEEPGRLANVIDLLRDEGLLSDPDPIDGPPTDTTRESVTHPADRDAVLQELARGETGAVTALGYSALRGYGQVHPTLAEVRVGRLPVQITHPYTDESATVCHTQVSTAEAVVPVFEKRDDPQFAFGYGLTYGRNERKAIGMTILDASIQLDGADSPAEDPEFVLDTIDGMESFGFIEHLKLPHYVTFQSILDRIRAIRERKGVADGDRVPSSAQTGADGDTTGETPPSDDDPDGRPVAEVSDDD